MGSALLCFALLGMATGLAAPGQERMHLVFRSGPPLQVVVHARKAGRLQPIAPPFTYSYRGKMASAADVDGDGQLDLLVLVRKKTRYDPRLAWRPFVFTLQEGRWVPKWLGSRVGRPLLEAAFVRTPAGVRLLTLERFGNDSGALNTGTQTVLTLYHWRGFGFWGEWTSAPLPRLSGLQVIDKNGDGVEEISLKRPEGMRTWFIYQRGGFVEIQAKGEVK